MTTCKNGTVVKDETFKAFGEQLTSTGSFNNTHRFTGKEYETSGIYYFGARYYDPILGRFLTPDPLGKFAKKDPRTINPYVYCSNNPLKYVDPDGKFQTKQEDGVLIAFREIPARAFLKDLGHTFIAGSRTIENEVRKKEGDVLVTPDKYESNVSDDILTALGSLLPIAGNLAIHYAKGALEQAFDTKSPYEELGEYQKAKKDEKIFEAITGEKDQWEIPLGPVGERKTEKELGRLRILLELEAMQIDYYR